MKKVVIESFSIFTAVANWIKGALQVMFKTPFFGRTYKFDNVRFETRENSEITSVQIQLIPFYLSQREARVLL